MALAVGNFFVHHHAVETFFGRFRKKFFSDRDVFFGRETKSIDQAFHFRLGFLNALANLDFLLACEQRDLAHLVHVHPDRVIEDFQARIFLFFRFGGLGALDFGVINDFNIGITQLGIKLVQVIRGEAIRQHVIDIVVGDVSMLLVEVQQGFDRLAEIYWLGRCGRSSSSVSACVGGFGLGSGAEFSGAIGIFLPGCLWLGVTGSLSRNNKAAQMLGWFGRR